MADDKDKNAPDDAQDIPNPAGTYSTNPSARVRQTARSASKIAEKARWQARREVEEELETLRAQLDTYAERADEATREAVETARRRAREAYRDLRDSAADSYDDLRERAEHGLDEAGEWAREHYEDAREWAHEHYDEAVDAGRRGYRRSRAYARQHPLAIGALGLAAGLVLGALLPRRDPPHPPRWYEPEHYGYERDPRRARRRW
ncbi:hypothetical protein [Saliniramus sp.]|uniref:DUF883 family protein n=1 Tax=Saliniramus sp. TaxID=2986772 RepID=UPI002C28ED13|nr:hypothetical protein [Saliniramus sp.]HMB11570.1 hypothetical protein [Saliniramus sp.]